MCEPDDEDEDEDIQQQRCRGRGQEMSGEGCIRCRYDVSRERLSLSTYAGRRGEGEGLDSGSGLYCVCFPVLFLSCFFFLLFFLSVRLAHLYTYISSCRLLSLPA